MNADSIELGDISQIKPSLNQPEMNNHGFSLGNSNISNTPFDDNLNSGPNRGLQSPSLRSSRRGGPGQQIIGNNSFDIQNNNNALLNSLMSPYHSRVHTGNPEEEEDSSDDIYLFGDQDENQDEPLLDNNEIIPQPKLVALLKACYFYLRVVLGSIFLAYSIYLLFAKNEQKVCWDVTKHGHTTEKCKMQKLSHSGVRVVFAVVIILLLDPIKCSIIWNFFHRKQMIQLQITLVLWIVFIINNAEDELIFDNNSFPGREKETTFFRRFRDVFYGFSKARLGDFLVNLSYLIFDLILYPNSLYFTTMIVLFFFLVVGLLAITLLNYLGLTNINVDFLAGVETGTRNGLSENEMRKLNKGIYQTTRERPVEELNTSNLSESEVMCSICFAPFTREAQVIYLPQCNHVFHGGCIEAWLKQHGTCPLCRCDIKDILKEENEENPNEFLLNSSMFEIADV